MADEISDACRRQMYFIKERPGKSCSDDAVVGFDIYDGLGLYMAL